MGEEDVGDLFDDRSRVGCCGANLGGLPHLLSTTSSIRVVGVIEQ
jgi:hypothetical protein